MKDGVRGFFTNPSRADDCFVPFSSGAKLLWSREKSPMSSDTISLDLSNYDGVLIKLVMWSEYSDYVYEYIPKGVERNFGITLDAPATGMHTTTWRDVAVSETSVVFGSGYWLHNTGQFSQQAYANVPLEIYGIKGLSW